MHVAARAPVAIFRDKPGFLERFRDGSRDALAAVYWAHVRRVEGWVRRGFLAPRGTRLDGVRSPDLDDLVQEIFVKAFSDKALLSFDGLRDYSPFLFTIARNAVIDWSRKQGREVPLDDEEAE